MNTKRRVILIIGLFFLALTGVRSIWLLLLAPSPSTPATQGVLDLRTWDYDADQAITLQGEWEFYPHTFIRENPSDRLSTRVDREIAEVPGNWNSLVSDKGDSTFGYGSYRLRIQVQADPNRVYGIRIPTLASSSELYVDGRLVGHSGKPAADPERYMARAVPYSASFSTNRSEIEIVLHIANFDDRLAGGLSRLFNSGATMR